MQNPYIKALIAILAGILGAFVVITFVESLSTIIAPTPKGLDFYNKEAMTAYMQSAPLSMYIFVLLGYVLSAFAGGWVTNLVARGQRYHPALITGFGLLVFGILNMRDIWHPLWFWVLSCPSYLIFAWLGGKMVKNITPGQ